MDIYTYCVKNPEIPDVSMSFSDANVKAYVEGNTQRTKEITFHAAGQQSVTTVSYTHLDVYKRQQ